MDGMERPFDAPPGPHSGRDASHMSFAKREARLVVAFLVLVAALLAVVRLGFEIHEDGTSSFDRWLLLALRSPTDLVVPVGPGWLRPAAVDISALGGATVLTLVTVAAIGYLLSARRWTTAALVATATISGRLLGLLLKSTFARTRPTLVPHFVDVHSLSFPSGHATNSAVVFLTLGALLASAQTERAPRVYVLATAILFTVLVGCSRVYNGVHWPTDVLAGWVIGGSWALVWWAVALRLYRHRTVDLQPSRRLSGAMDESANS